MKRFILKITVFIILIFLLIIIELLLPLDTFAFRPHEALLFQRTGIAMHHYPNHQIRMRSWGDLCSYSNYAIEKDELWITDSLGYRNNDFIRSPDVLLIGDSFIMGTGLTQDSTITNLLNERLGDEISVYNLSEAFFQDFTILLEKKIIDKPKLIIFELGERNLPKEFLGESDETVNSSSALSIIYNKATRLYSIQYIMSRILKTNVKGIQSEVESRMFFLNGRSQESFDGQIYNVVNIIQSYKNYCDSLGIEFLFLPLPNKETVYFDFVPLDNQPDYLFKLDSLLRNRNINTINSLKAFNNFRSNSDSLIYHYDDTHWNSTGVNIIADEIERFISNQFIL